MRTTLSYQVKGFKRAIIYAVIGLGPVDSMPYCGKASSGILPRAGLRRPYSTPGPIGLFCGDRLYQRHFRSFFCIGFYLVQARVGI